MRYIKLSSPAGCCALTDKESNMTDNIQVDRLGRPITGITTTKSVPAIAGIPEEDDE